MKMAPALAIGSKSNKNSNLSQKTDDGASLSILFRKAKFKKSELK